MVSGQGPDGPGYTGHENDTETGLVYMQARYYDPVGRFLSPDPVTPSAGGLFEFNRYDYTDNNPVNHTDPEGRCIDGVTCGPMVQSYGKWAAANPAQADKIGSTVGVAGVSAMLAVTGAPEAIGAAAVLRAGVRYVAGKIASAVVRRAVRNAAIRTTAHGAERLAGDAATRGGVLSADEAKSVMQTGRAMTQADGANVRIVTNETGRSNVVVSGDRGIVTTFKNLSEKSLNRLAKRYEWKPPDPKKP